MAMARDGEWTADGTRVVAGGRTVAIVDPFGDSDEARGRVALIAAAPRLLAMCEVALRALDRATSGTMHGVEDEAEQIKAAIAATEGMGG